MLIRVILFCSFVITSGAFAVTPEKDVFDLGIFGEGEERSVDITIRNDTSASETIADIKVSCGCTSYKLEGAKTVLPGEQRVIHANINNKGASGFRKIDVLVLIREKPAPVALSIVGYSLPSTGLTIPKSYLDFGELRMLETKTKRLAVFGTKEALGELEAASRFYLRWDLTRFGKR